MRERKRRNFNQGYKGGLHLGRFSGIIVMIGIFGMLALYSVLQSNNFSVRGEAISKLEARKMELVAEKERLEVEASRLQSLQEIQKTYGNSGSQKLVPVQKINYLPSSNVAVK